MAATSASNVSPNNPLTQALDREALARPTDLAITFLGPSNNRRDISWSELARRVGAIASRLTLNGWPGAVLCVPAGTDEAGVLELLGAVAGNCRVFPFDPSAPDTATDHLRAALCVTGEPWVLVADALQSQNTVAATHQRLSVYLATGGSTGEPKLIERHVRSRASELLRKTGWTSGQRQMVLGPLYHAAGLDRLIDGVIAGNHVILPENLNPLEIAAAVEDCEVNWMQFTPSHMRLLEPHFRHANLEHLRGVLHSAAPCPDGTKEAWLSFLPADCLWEMYTSTEGIGTTLCSGQEWLLHRGTVGRGFFTQIRILADSKPVPAGEVGDVYMRSVQHSQPGQRAESFVSVGDRGFLDDGGYLYLAGRRTGHAIVGGENVYTSEIEAALVRHPSVSGAIVVDVPDEVLGSALSCVLELRPGSEVTKRSIIEYCVENLALHSVPRQVTFIPDLPRTAAGKVSPATREEWRRRLSR